MEDVARDDGSGGDLAQDAEIRPTAEKGSRAAVRGKAPESIELSG